MTTYIFFNTAWDILAEVGFLSDEAAENYAEQLAETQGPVTIYRFVATVGAEAP